MGVDFITYKGKMIYGFSNTGYVLLIRYLEQRGIQLFDYDQDGGPVPLDNKSSANFRNKLNASLQIVSGGEIEDEPRIPENLDDPEIEGYLKSTLEHVKQSVDELYTS